MASHDSTHIAQNPIRVVQNKKYVRDGAKSYLHLMRKYNFNPTLESKYFHSGVLKQQGKFAPGVGGKATIVQRLKKKTGPGENDVSLVDTEDVQNDALWLSEVSIGTPPKKFLLDFDTSSADCWVWSTHLPDDTLKKASGKSVFDPDQSSSYKAKDGYTWNIHYGDGSSASGTVGTDYMTFGGLTIESQAIELANNLSDSFQQGQGDGLLGLAFSNINTCSPDSVLTPVDMLIQQANIPASAELFTCKLGSWRDKYDEPDHGESFYTFGYIHQPTLDYCGATVSSIDWAKIDSSKGFWQFKSSSISINGKTKKRPSSNISIADTGTTLVLLDDASCDAIYKTIPGAQYIAELPGYIYPASVTESQLPVVKIDVGGKSFAIQKEDLGFADVGQGYVFGGIQSRGTLPLDILGGTFLKGQYAIFDAGKKRLGLVPRPEVKQNLATPVDGVNSSSEDEAPVPKHRFLSSLIEKNKTVERQAEL
ncbi:hypothetical protein H072_2030 [Dactylellina haptotyla CBS 200.50]|uniref:Peptidase A1 domain-containing protein n=1 Tax=Dactylellina haptotyla (strain CBS 200.50) TaxID=1284197 RepID=S8ASD7_DACHA|nr:hypothetical protein H072_2030 [Dactylellina haptotyla CBS 200.50]